MARLWPSPYSAPRMSSPRHSRSGSAQNSQGLSEMKERPKAHEGPRPGPGAGPRGEWDPLPTLRDNGFEDTPRWSTFRDSAAMGWFCSVLGHEDDGYEGNVVSILRQKRSLFSKFLLTLYFLFYSEVEMKYTSLNVQINETEKSTNSSGKRQYDTNFRNRSSGGFYVNKLKIQNLFLDALSFIIRWVLPNKITNMSYITKTEQGIQDL